MKKLVFLQVYRENWMPISIVFLKANCHDATTVQQTIDAMMIQKPTNKIPFMGDKGYPSKKNSKIIKEKT